MELEVFKDLSEFEESRNVMMGTIEEYKSAEGVDYIHCLVCSEKTESHATRAHMAECCLERAYLTG